MILYLGLDPKRFPRQDQLVHYPVICTEKIEPNPSIMQQWDEFTHVIFTSQTAVRYWFDRSFSTDKVFIAIGQATKEMLASKGIHACTARQETQEGVIALLETLSLQDAFLFWPRSKKARSNLADYIEKRGVQHLILDLYDTVFQMPSPPPSLHGVQEIVFTSPSTVFAFLKIYGSIPQDVRLTAIGPITQEVLEQSISSRLKNVMH